MNHYNGDCRYVSIQWVIIAITLRDINLRELLIMRRYHLFSHLRLIARQFRQLIKDRLRGFKANFNLNLASFHVYIFTWSRAKIEIIRKTMYRYSWSPRLFEISRFVIHFTITKKCAINTTRTIDFDWIAFLPYISGPRIFFSTWHNVDG